MRTSKKLLLAFFFCKFPMATTINRTNIAMLSREMRNNDWRINGLERKLDALNAKLNDLLEEGGSGGSGEDNTDNCNCISYTAGNGITINDNNAINVNYNEETMELINGKLSVKASGDNTGGGSGSDAGSGGDNTGGGSGSGGKLTFKLNENIRYITSASAPAMVGNNVWNVYTTTQTFNGTPTAIDSVDAIYLVEDGISSLDTSRLDDIMGGDWSFLSSDYTIRVGDALYYTTAYTNYPPYAFANIETDNGIPRTIFAAYSYGARDLDLNAMERRVRTIGTPAAIRNRVLSPDGTPYLSRPGEPGGAAFTLTTDYFATSSLLEEYKANGTLYVKDTLDGDNFTITDNMELFDTVLSDIYVVVTPYTSIKAFEVSYH